MVLYTSFSALAASPSWPLRTWTRTKSTRGACIWLCLINVLHQCGWTYALFLVTNLYYGWIILANLVNVSSFRKNVICKFELSWAVLLCPWICLIICWMCPWMCYCVQSVCPVMNNLIIIWEATWVVITLLILIILNVQYSDYGSKIGALCSPAAADHM